MRIGLAYDLKEEVQITLGLPDDALEEYDSPETLAGLRRVFESEGHSVINLGGGRRFLQNILTEKVDLVFNISEGLGNYRGREAQVPSVLEMLNIPYTGADPQTLAVCLDKSLTKKLVDLEGIPTPKWQVIRKFDEMEAVDWCRFSFPVFAKPMQDGSSKGVRFGSLIENRKQLSETVPQLLSDYRQPIMVEEFIDGDEITVGVTGNAPATVLGIMRILPVTRQKNFIYSLEVKRDWERLVTYECPAQLDAHILARIEQVSLKAFEVLGCRDFGRIDFRLAPDGTPYFIEINPLAGLNPRSSDLPIMAEKLGISYNELILKIFKATMERYPLCVSA